MHVFQDFDFENDIVANFKAGNAAADVGAHCKNLKL